MAKLSEIKVSVKTSDVLDYAIRVKSIFSKYEDHLTEADLEEIQQITDEISKKLMTEVS